MKGESVSIHHDQIHDTLLSHLAFKAGSCSQSTGNSKKKTTTFLDSAVPTKSFQGQEWADFQEYAPAVPHRPSNTPPGSEAAWIVLVETSALFASEMGLLTCLLTTK